MKKRTIVAGIVGSAFLLGVGVAVVNANFDSNASAPKKVATKGEVSIDLVLSKNAKPEKVLKQLYKRNTGLKVTFPVGITVIDDYAEYEYGIKDLLLAWIDYRIDAVRSMLINKHQILLSDQHINEVLLILLIIRS